MVERPAGAVVPVQGSRSAGKSTLLESIAQLNPQLETLILEGSGGTSGDGGASGEPPSVERTRALLDSVKNPARTLVLIDDLQYLQPAVQQLLLERRGEFRAMLVAYTPWPRRASSPLLAALMGCSRALLLAPASLADADMCTVTALPLDRFTQGEQPAGRIVVVDGASVCAAQVPGAEHGCTGCNSYAEGAGSGLKLSTLAPSYLGFSGVRGLRSRGLAASAAVLLRFFARLLSDRLNIAAATGHEHEDEGSRRTNNTRNRDELADIQAVSTHVHDEVLAVTHRVQRVIRIMGRREPKRPR